MAKTLPPSSHPPRCLSVAQGQGHLPGPEEEHLLSLGMVRAFCHHAGLHLASGSAGVPGRPVGQSHPQTLLLEDQGGQEASVSCQCTGPFPPLP